MQYEDQIIKAVERVRRCIVNVSTVKISHDHFLERFPVRGIGSGFIIDPNGIILTNNHVVEGADSLQIILPDGSRTKGKIIGRDPSTDLAVAKIEGKNLPYVELGDSDLLKVGQTVIAIGNPFGLPGGPTATVGIISALGRSIQSEKGILENLIQTDAAINPGNSGGPLIDIKGRAIGITTAIIPYAQGMGFAIPSNTAREITYELIKYGRVIKPWLGIYGVDVTRNLAEYYNLPANTGVLVVRIIRGGPAHRAGLESGDIIVELDGIKLETIKELTSHIGRRKVGEKIEITLLRGRRKFKTFITLGEQPR
jgi:S1-C subfamily serine protease